MPFIRWFENITLADVGEVGGKNASLGELVHAFGASGMALPRGFAVTASAYRHFLVANHLEPGLRIELGRLSPDPRVLPEVGAAVRGIMMAGELPPELGAAIAHAYRQLAARLGEDEPAVAVRSSATAEDLPGASFAGQQESFLGVRGERALLDAVHRCYASLFTDRAIAYREAQGFGHLQVALSVGVHEMLAWPECESAGVVFSVDPETGFPGVIVVSGSWGLGEMVVQGRVSPDEYLVSKLGLETAPEPILRKLLGSKERKLTQVGEAETTPAERSSWVLQDPDLLTLSRWTLAIERHYGCGMDVEWAKDGRDGRLYILQARPETVHAGASRSPLRTFALLGEHVPLIEGIGVGQAIASGRARVVADFAGVAFDRGDVLVAKTTSPDWVPLMRRASAVITDSGGRTSHAAIVSRELGVPAVVGTGAATTTVPDGDVVTVSCAEGADGRVYAGAVRFEESTLNIDELPVTDTKIMLNLAIPDAAFRWWRLPHDGIGLARIEFIINNDIRIHPLALVHPESVVDAASRAEIERRTAGYADNRAYFVRKLAEGISVIAASAVPRPVIVRFSDFKTNEYARLIGGPAFEPVEANPMLGWRGASRYYDPRYREAFALECQAIRRAREDAGLTNIVVMIPFCRTVREAERVLAEMAENGLVRGRDGLEVYLMCEVPSNVVLAAEFAQHIDGFSIGSNDLTQLTLGIDRDSAALARLFDERDAAVTRLIESVIDTAHQQGCKVGICGQAPSDHPDFAAFLVEAGIDSISVNPDSFARTKRVVAQAEAARRA